MYPTERLLVVPLLSFTSHHERKKAVGFFFNDTVLMYESAC